MEDHERGGGLAAELRGNRVVTRGEFHSRHVADARDLALRPLLDDDVCELLFVEQTSLRADRELKILAGGNGRLADGAGGNLEVLLADGAHDIAGRHVARGGFLRVDPDAHRVVTRSECRHISDTLDARKLVLHLQKGVVAEVKFIPGAVRRDEMRHHREVGRSFRGRHPETTHFLRQLRQRDRHAVLHEHLRNVEIGSELEGNGQAHHAVAGRSARHVKHVLDAVDFLLDGRGDGFGEHLRVRARIHGAHDDGRWRDFGILRDRQLERRNSANQHDDDGKDRRENRTPNEEVRKVHLGSGGLGSTTTPGRTRSSPSMIICSSAFKPLRTTRRPSIIGPI